MVCIKSIVLSPSEMLDGALVNGNYRQPGRAITYAHSNNYMVRELYRRHGVEVNFLGGVIGRGWQDTQGLKARQGWMMARVARHHPSRLAARGVCEPIAPTRFDGTNLPLWQTYAGLRAYRVIP